LSFPIHPFAKENTMAIPARRHPPTALDLAIRAQIEKDEKKIEEDEKERAKINAKKPNMALNILLRLMIDVINKADGWETCARNFGTAYTRAAKNHKDALADAAKYHALDAQGMFSALTLLMTGALSAIWNSDTIQQASDLIKNTLKDVLLTGFGEAFSAMGPGAVALPPDKGKTIDDDALDDLYKEPLECQNKLQNQVRGWKHCAMNLIAAQLSDLQQNMFDDRFWDEWSPRDALKEINSWMHGDGRSPGSAAIWGMDPDKSEQNVTAMAFDLERAMWAKWMPRLRTVSTMTPFDSGYEVRGRVGDRLPGHLVQPAAARPGLPAEADLTKEDYAAVKGPIENRFRELKILQEAGLPDGIHWYHSAQSEDTKLLAWARRFLAPGGHPVWNTEQSGLFVTVSEDAKLSFSPETPL
jgi:hypothetical protein